MLLEVFGKKSPSTSRRAFWALLQKSFLLMCTRAQMLFKCFGEKFPSTLWWAQWASLCTFRPKKPVGIAECGGGGSQNRTSGLR
ncbi:unnamed protein product [Periconia digitata]|uniref:Uncharacterized protein n=1 Tax=Periconia digitata TaxID=1303443 RepID=A0A9W4U8P4_9PLEO|nr:unnamed protein product [Periconia digitata]